MNGGLIEWDPGIGGMPPGERNLIEWDPGIGGMPPGERGRPIGCMCFMLPPGKHRSGQLT